MSEHTAESDAPMHLWVEPRGDLTACGIRWWNGTRGGATVTCDACRAVAVAAVREHNARRITSPGEGRA